MKTTILSIILLATVLLTIFSQEDTNFVEKREYTAKYINDGDIIIDGVAENAWDFADTMFLDHNAAGATFNDKTDLSGNARICWNEDGLYIFIGMKDESIIKHSDFENPSSGEWDYDCVEIYTNNTGKRDANDVSYSNRAECIRINIGDEETQKLSGTIDTSLRIHNYAITYPAGGYIVEFFLPFSYIKPDTINLSTRWGFNIQVPDNDTEDESDIGHIGVLGWNNWDAEGNALSDQHWQNINYFGVLFLSSENLVNIHDEEYQNIQIYPNPANNIIHFKFPDDNLYTIEIFNILGTNVYSAKIINNQPIDVAFLPKNTYIIKISGERYVKCEKLIIH